MSHTVDSSMRAYYRRRAPEYDQWYDREGRYDRGLANAPWHAELAELTAWVEGLRASRVLEIACGTGRWTRRLAQHNRIVACDFAPEMLAETRSACAGVGVQAFRVRADAYTLPFPDNAFDAVFFGFWLSHVFPDRLARFGHEVGRVLRPGGEVWVCDSGWSRDSGAVDHDPAPSADTGGVHTRKLNDGSSWAVYKQCFTAALLAHFLRAWGPRPETHETREHFVWGRVRLPGG